MTKRNPSMTESLTFLKSKMLPISYIVDIGILNCTKALVKVYPDIPHILVEPVRSYYPAIESFYKNNNIDYVLIKAAASNKTSLVKLVEYSADKSGTITHSEIVDINKTDIDNRVVSTVTVDGLTIGDILYRAGKSLELSKEKFLLKMDIDGFEDEILEASNKYLINCICIVLEVPILNFYKRLKIVAELGFEAVDIVDPCYYKNGLSQVDVIFVKPEYKNKLGINTWYGNTEVDFKEWQSYED
jgi:FkbM family methyltransferase